MEPLNERVSDLLNKHGVYVDVREVVLWTKPFRSGVYFGSGIALFTLVHLGQLGMLTVLGRVICVFKFVGI